MSPTFSFVFLFTILLSTSCEARIMDKDGTTIKQSRPRVLIERNESNKLSTHLIQDLDVKGVTPYIDFENNIVTYNRNEISGAELYIKVDFSKLSVNIYLGEDFNNGNLVAAINTGDKDFHAVNSAPISGYNFDSQTEFVIGNKFYNGGNGWTGFYMTNDVYVIKTRNGRYAKVQFLKAKAGKVDLQYAISKESSLDLKTK